MMTSARSLTRPAITLLTASLVMATSAGAAAQSTEILYVTGSSTDSSRGFFESPMSESVGTTNPDPSGEDTRAYCAPVGSAMMAIGMAASLAGLGGSTEFSVQAALGDDSPELQEIGGMIDSAGNMAMGAYQEMCIPRPGTTKSFQIVYTECSMTMMSPDGWMRMVMPPDGSPPQMIAVSSTGQGTREPMDMSILFNDEQLSRYLPTGRMESNRVGSGGGAEVFNIEMTAALGEQTFFSGTTPVTAAKHDFRYEGAMNAAFMQMQVQGESSFPLGEIRLISDGSAWLSQEVPGWEIVRTFYANLQDAVVPSAATDTLIGGMFAHLTKLTQKGFPLSTTQNTAVRISGMPNIGKKSTSTMNVTGVLWARATGDWCSATTFPEDWQVVSLEDTLAEAAADGGAGQAGPGSAAGGPSQDEMAQAMAQAQQAMEGMTPEQREAMEQMGLSGMMEGLMGGAGASAGATAAASAPPQSSSKSGSSASLSAALKTDNETETAQNYLQALGYDTGGASGEMTIETTIAISQFQAEKGLEVTGEVTPQLLDVLAAAVDAL